MTVSDANMRAGDVVPPYGRGALLVLLAGAWLSLGGLIVRHIAVADDWQTVFYRSLSALAGLLLVMAVRDRAGLLRTFLRSGLAGVIAGMGMSVSMVTFILAVNATSVANALFLLAGAPFLTAVLAWLVLRERVGRITWLAMSIAMFGVAIMVWHGIEAGTLFGNAMALLTALGFAVFAVALRAGRQADMLPAVCIAGTISAGFAALVILDAGTGFAVPPGDLGLCALLGALMAGTLAVYTFAARSVPSAVLALLSLTEVLLGPFWVWLFLNEEPSGPTLLGGGILLAAIAGQAVAGLRRN